MKHWVTVAGRVAGGLLAAAAGVAALGTLRWNRATTRAVARLDQPAAAPPAYQPEQLAGLPAPVARYFRFALAPGQLPVRRARLHEQGEFRTAPDAPWSPFTADHHVQTMPPGFVWDARIWLLPVLPVRVRDAYLGGAGAMQDAFAGVVPVVDEAGRPDLNAGALLRYLAEAVWYPTALLPGQGVRWSPLDEHRALATLTDGSTTVSLEFHFGAQGEVVRVYTPARFRDVNGHGVPTPWGGTFGGYARLGGMMRPQRGEVSWFLPEGEFAYWRGRLRSEP
ncbi:hypothetical protein LJ737_04040 [Hymenobacter sp. 15J16-1T3B]|uniref:DUF6544 family protein n=1 Tax=Hymenobacter sp. 15J16-1T3B TaxID=2886941 RepID=UPI001D127B5E|nr:DUF6544 family protein [Hymenobacter sp. 15J16-1T3B]MCC3156393.1 hypothetical protein [Hymenobacter sp. 15J16-1T3B]